MEGIFTLESKTGNIVLDFPKSSSMLKGNNIGFCCKNNRPIGEISEDLGLDKHEILHQLNELYIKNQPNEETVNQLDMDSVNQITSYILERHQEFKKDLDEVDGYVTKIYRVHGGRFPELVSIHSLYQMLKEQLSHVMQRKENVLLPMKEQPDSNEKDVQLKQLLINLEQDYKNIEELITSLRKTTEALGEPEGVCTTFKLTFLKLDEMFLKKYC